MALNEFKSLEKAAGKNRALGGGSASLQGRLVWQAGLEDLGCLWKGQSSAAFVQG